MFYIIWFLGGSPVCYIMVTRASLWRPRHVRLGYGDDAGTSPQTQRAIQTFATTCSESG